MSRLSHKDARLRSAIFSQDMADSLEFSVVSSTGVGEEPWPCDGM